MEELHGLGEWAISRTGEVHIQTEDGKWVKMGSTSEAGIALDGATTTVSSWGGAHFTWTNPDAEVQEIIDEKTGGHMAKRVSAHADPKFTDGVWICSVCESESMDKEMFEEAGQYEECAKNHARVVTGEEKDALGRYVAGVEAKQNLDRATKAIKDFKAGMDKLGLAAVEMSLLMQVALDEEITTASSEEVTRLLGDYPEFAPNLEKARWPVEVVEEEVEWMDDCDESCNGYDVLDTPLSIFDRVRNVFRRN